MGVQCSCFSCVHPDSDNAGTRVLHTERHLEFQERMDDIELGRRVARTLIASLPPFLVQRVSGTCDLMVHRSMPPHPASHR